MIRRDYHLAQDNCGLKPQDFVEVLAEPADSRYFWSWRWAREHQDLVGKTCRVVRIDDVDGVMLALPDVIDYAFLPFFLLKKVNAQTCSFKPYDRVLVRSGKNGVWRPALFGRYYPERENPYETMYPTYFSDIRGNYIIPCYSECIAYEGNENLAYTSEEPKAS